MGRFTSAREQRLWLWALAAVVAIYSTLGLARTLADELVERQLIDTAFFWAFLAILAAIVLVGLRVRPSGAELGVWVGVAAVYALVLLRIVLPEERSHVVEYGVVAIIVHEALVERRANGGPLPVGPAPLALAITVAVGTVDELIQLVIPSRVFDVADIVTNAVSAGLAIAAKLAVTWARGWGDRSSDPVDQTS